MTCADVHELSGAIALGAIPPDEWPAIREHLATCTRGHPEIDQLRVTATLLLEAAPPDDPPAGLRDRIL
ncbi:MAG: anti-sigma factor, partial [Dehalococcoidia bacterium]